MAGLTVGQLVEWEVQLVDQLDIGMVALLAGQTDVVFPFGLSTARQAVPI